MIKKTQLLIALGALLIGASAWAQGVTLPSVQLGLKSVNNPQEVVSTIKILMVMTVLTLAPAIMILMTSFTRIIIVFSFLRQALGTQQMPPNQLLVGLSLFLTFFIMGPAFDEVNSKAVQPYLEGKLPQEAALEAGLAPLRKFMFRQTKDEDLGLFVKLAKIQRPKTRADVPTTVLIPSFIISELKTAFFIGFVIYLPFLVIDMVIASVLMAMGMMMLPPVVISLPFKIMLFLLIDGWSLLIGSMVQSFN